MMKVIGIIPARYASTRFPGKPLAEIGGEPMIWHVYCRAAEAFGDCNTVVATDDRRIFDAVTRRGGRAVITDRDADSGTARCLQAIDLLGEEPEVVINVQGDEPFISPDDLHRLADCFADPAVEIATLARCARFPADREAILSPDNPKVVTDLAGNALYFSRAVVPAVREPSSAEDTEFYLHIGSYAYRTSALRRITSLPPAPLEQAERLEQLRWLEAGLKIRIVLTDRRCVSVDTPADLQQARLFYQSLKK